MVSDGEMKRWFSKALFQPHSSQLEIKMHVYQPPNSRPLTVRPGDHCVCRAISLVGPTYKAVTPRKGPCVIYFLILRVDFSSRQSAYDPVMVTQMLG